jgi:hypothetical protein
MSVTVYIPFWRIPWFQSYQLNPYQPLGTGRCSYPSHLMHQAPIYAYIYIFMNVCIHKRYGSIYMHQYIYINIYIYIYKYIYIYIYIYSKWQEGVHVPLTKSIRLLYMHISLWIYIKRMEAYMCINIFTSIYRHQYIYI